MSNESITLINLGTRFLDRRWVSGGGGLLCKYHGEITLFISLKYPLRKKVLVQMLKLKLESEEDSTMALELIRFIKKLLAELEPEDFDGDEEDL
ncbi:hypothetical protein Tco_1504695 [Tanacetum coccineum]